MVTLLQTVDLDKDAADKGQNKPTKAVETSLIINGEVVPSSVIAAETQNQTAPKGKPGLAWEKAAKAVALRTLLLQEARRRDIAPDCQQVGPGRFETEEEALIRELLDGEVDIELPSEESIISEWRKDPTRFRAPPLWEVSHILCACDPRDEETRKKASERATKLAKLACANPDRFIALAARESDCSSKASGGALGQLGPGDTVPEFEKVLKTLKEGAVTETPVLSRHGYHVIRMDALAEGAVLPFDTVRPRIAEALEKVQWAKVAQAFVNQLVSRSHIKGVEMTSV